ncbi:MarR family winged helix-turn-helix transcriptional regulator [Fodinicola acaciae]|uniref:MarR family winged helix-turn-helix transcriptional regulator n=1 Tax=Fodinicola acaciae TaxID=2681555 RepID=UPI0013D71DAF|nr:MarR family transcriptional regulator [Fodinicola acaciae]
MDETTQLAAALVGLSHQVLRLFAEVGRRNRLSQQQVEMICAVIVREKVGMSELAKILHLEKSGLSNLVDRAEQRGLVIRTRDPDDRRVTWVELTDEGRALAADTHAEVTARMAELVAKVAPRDQKRLTAVIQEMLRPAASGRAGAAPR